MEPSTDTNQSASPQPSGGNNLAVPISIVIAGGLVAFALYSRGPATQPPTPSNEGTAAVAGALGFEEPSENDHILGNPNAPIKIVEYSDLECPFCKQFHNTMHQIMAEYGADGRVAWIYRHFPLESIHPKARQEAIATECAAKQGGNNAFWAYTDKIFEITPSNNGLDLALLPQVASDIGLDRSAFEACLASGEFDQFITDSFNAAIAAGAEGTPYSVIVGPDGHQIPINGALPYQSVKQAVETVLSNL